MLAPIPQCYPKAGYLANKAEIDDAVLKVMDSGNYILGEEVKSFEKEFAKFTEVEHALGVASGTDALELALRACGIGPGDSVVTVSHTAVATVSAIDRCGAIPIFADIDEHSYTMSPDSLLDLMKKCYKLKPKAVIPVHLYGHPADMENIKGIADEFKMPVIEDCAQAHGAIYKGRSVGSIGHIGAWSFCQDKIMTTGGEGGMVTTSYQELWSKMWSYKDHGKSYEAVYEKEHPPGFRWVHESFGTNFRMIEIQAAIGRIQLRKMTDWTSKRNANAKQILLAAGQFSGESGIIRAPQFQCQSCTSADKEHCSSTCVHAHYKCYVYVQPQNLAKGWSRDRIIEEITARGVPCFQGSCSEVYLEKAFDGTGFRPANRLPVAKELGETSLMFLVHPTLTDSEITKTCNVIKEVFSLASKY